MFMRFTIISRTGKICSTEKKKSVAKKGTLNNFNSYLNTRPNQSWATMVETSSLNNTPLLLPKNYVC